ncbi:Multidrug resistance-associated ABC transporter protein [Mycena sanguinolenta]|uniref:Multidrug resistance-associated ABC transporter protein n=1 Tax=Mycena sanguinolenta TaxID=230812 RepID=A0A8H6XXF3_9AGAR|nr:Multidrug resistance-associated ABC transporter protein [Mycena sanguinolenta]
MNIVYSHGPELRPLFIPACATAISAFIFLLRFAFSRSNHMGDKNAEIPPPGIGRGVIFGFRIARLLGSLTLLALSIFPSNDGLGRGVLRVTPYVGFQSIFDAIIDNPQLYASILACLSLNPRKTRHRLVRHANCILFCVFCVYVYRDLVPLATFTGIPADIEEGHKLWAEVGVLFATAVIIPLFTPRQYIPVDPLNPQTILNPEQTASIFSFTFYFFLDQIIFLAYRQSQLLETELYPLFSGTKSRRHLFFGLMRVFYREYIIISSILVLRVFTVYAGPYAMNKLLQYIETRDQGAEMVVRPWVWIALMFIGPLIGSVAFQTQIFIATRNLVRVEAIITELVFAHSLRIRVKAETGTENTAGDASAVETASPSATAESDTENTETATSENDEGSSGSEDESATVQASSSSIKSAAKDEVKKPDVKKSGGSLVGKINNLVTVDLGNIVDARDFIVLAVYTPLQLGIGIYFLYVLLGWAVWVGVASIILLAPVPGYMAKLVQSVHKERMKQTDERVQSVSEAVHVLRMIKLFGWEQKIKARIEDKRDSELVWIQKRRYLDMASGLVNFLIPVSRDHGFHLRHLVRLFFKQNADAEFFLSTLIMGQSLNASKVFSSMTIFDMLRNAIAEITYRLNDAISGKVSLDRVNDFLKTTELLDAFDEKETLVLSTVDPSMDDRIGFCNARFFVLKIDDEVLFQRGRINLVIGPTGSGKTSLLMALLGEMHFIPSSPDSWYNLPRNSGVAYAAQESWVLNETIRSNIVFDTPFDEERYKKVLYQCALEPDLKLFQAGDQTEVGEKGLTLSGGQKARLTLARAVVRYFTRSVHTAQWIVEKCFGGDLIQNRTVILVTHNVALTRPIADFVVSFGADGRIQSQGTISEITKRGPLAAQIHKDQQVLHKTQQQVDTEAPVVEPAQGKLILAEEIQLGHVSSSSLKMYFSAMGGKHPFFFFIFFFGGLFFEQIFVALRTWQLGHWAKQYDDRPADQVDVIFNLSIFVGIVFVSITSFAIVFIYFVFGQLRASGVIHKNLLSSVLSAPLRWLDVTPTSRIIARVTNDVRAVDDSLGSRFYPLAYMLVSMMVKFGAVVIYTPIFLFLGVLVGALGAWVGQVYIAGQLPVKRLMSNTRAPVLAHFGAAIAGLVSIRAFGAQSKLATESLSRIDRYTRAARNYYNLNRWVGIRVDILGSIFSASLATYLVYVAHSSAGDTGFLINMAVTFTQMLLWTVRELNEFEGTAWNEYKDISILSTKSPQRKLGSPPAYWPAGGDLHVEGLSARYSEDGPEVLHDISFHVKAGERIGIVGRTGSGKSSLTLSLLRCIPTEGSVRYDGLETSKLNLDALRSSITIIPQVPELLSGSLRANLDPFGQYDDAELNYALRAAGLFALQSEMDEGRITLDSAISSGGSNLSVGQRQIFALARAIVRKSKILILDEATSAIDYKTDSIIQNSLRQELRGDVSLLTVAHRLQTIMDADKIMVLDAGRLVEFDRPKELLKIKDGKLRALVEESGDRDALYAMATAGKN